MLYRHCCGEIWAGMNVFACIQCCNTLVTTVFFSLLSDAPALIKVNLYIRSVSRIDDVRMVRKSTDVEKDCFTIRLSGFSVTFMYNWKVQDCFMFILLCRNIACRSHLGRTGWIRGWSMTTSMVRYELECRGQIVGFLTVRISTGKLKYLTMTETGRVWMPDTFFQNEKLGHFHDIIVPNVYIRIFPTGRVLYSIR